MNDFWIGFEKTAAASGWWDKVKSRNPDPKNSQLWSELKSQAKTKFGKWSRAAGLWVAREYKEKGGKYK